LGVSGIADSHGIALAMGAHVQKDVVISTSSALSTLST
jgi:hypothetical protein